MYGKILQICSLCIITLLIYFLSACSGYIGDRLDVSGSIGNADQFSAQYETGPLDDHLSDNLVFSGLKPAISFNIQGWGDNLRVIDLDGDPLPDLAVSLIGGGVKLLKNKSDNSVADFSVESLVFEDRLAFSVDTTDLDNDGIPEMAVGFTMSVEQSSDQCVQIYKQQNNDWNTCSGIATLPRSSRLITFDTVNSNDDIPDILTCDTDTHSMVAFYINDDLTFYNENPLFAAGRPNLRGASYGYHTLLDINNDGLNDLLVPDYNSSELQIHIHRNCSQNHMIPFVHQPYNSNLGYPQWFTDLDPSSQYYYRVLYAESDRSTKYDSAAYIKLQVNLRILKTTSADLDNDGIPDVAILSDNSPNCAGSPVALILDEAEYRYGNAAYIYKSVQNKSYKRNDELDVEDMVHGEMKAVVVYPGSMTDIEFADLDLDGNVDLVGCADGSSNNQDTSYLYYFPGLGNFHFSDPISYPLTSPPSKLLIEDVNLDGFQDIAVILPLEQKIDVFLALVKEGNEVQR